VNSRGKFKLASKGSLANVLEVGCLISLHSVAASGVWPAAAAGACRAAKAYEDQSTWNLGHVAHPDRFRIVALGAATGDVLGAQDDNASIAAIHKAIDLGIN